ncbi:hypothetical protein GCM10022251_29820 [Phytohabitans flavus]|uniref:Uncharacterized protein n=1 Tax=Phytohabitans flavus TaxID=1076124 RepID=A0A6F8XXB7_9ACTN|nr:hypothetical protein Pflav_048490 [Phytohabitans flavus]
MLRPPQARIHPRAGDRFEGGREPVVEQSFKGRHAGKCRRRTGSGRPIYATWRARALDLPLAER